MSLLNIYDLFFRDLKIVWAFNPILEIRQTFEERVRSSKVNSFQFRITCCQKLCCSLERSENPLENEFYRSNYFQTSLQLFGTFQCCVFEILPLKKVRFCMIKRLKFSIEINWNRMPMLIKQKRVFYICQRCSYFSYSFFKIKSIIIYNKY